MLACDLILEVRASRSLSADQVKRLERMAFGCGQPDRDQLEMLVWIDRYVARADPSWTALLARAAQAAKTLSESNARRRPELTEAAA